MLIRSGPRLLEANGYTCRQQDASLLKVVLGTSPTICLEGVSESTHRNHVRYIVPFYPQSSYLKTGNGTDFPKVAHASTPFFHHAPQYIDNGLGDGQVWGEKPNLLPPVASSPREPSF